MSAVRRMIFVLRIPAAGGWYVIRRRHPGGCTFDMLAGPFATQGEAQRTAGIERARDALL